MQPGVGTNRFAYSFNDPINKMDPAGNETFNASGLAAYEATFSQTRRDDMYSQNAATHENLWQQFSNSGGDPQVIQYHRDAADYFTGRIGISTTQLLAEASTDAAYVALGARFGTAKTNVSAGSYQTTSQLDIAETTAMLQDMAKRAAAQVGPGKGAVYGTKVHSVWGKMAEDSGAIAKSEVSYLNGKVARHGEKGSIRCDGVCGSAKAPTAVFDLKTGAAGLSSQRIAQIRSHLPQGYQNIPIIEIKP